MFHVGEFIWLPGQSSFAQHFGGDKNKHGSSKTSSAEKIYQGVTGGGEHGNDH
jgi:hypothetical protein